MIIDPRYQGMGYGVHLEKYMRNILSSRAYNLLGPKFRPQVYVLSIPDAWKFYEKIGYREIITKDDPSDFEKPSTFQQEWNHRWYAILLSDRLCDEKYVK
jgi:hypothetical protein